MFEKIAQFDGDKGLTFQEAIAKANKRKLRIPSNLEIDSRLQGEEWKKEKEMYPCWTGTLIIYEAVGKAFGKTVEYQGLTFNVPKAFQGKKGAAIVVNHPDFILKDDVITPGKSTKCIPLPDDDGWYLPEPQFGIPNGSKGEDDGKHRKLWRWQDKAYIGLVARCYGRWLGRYRRVVDAYYVPSSRLGVHGTATGKVKPPPHRHEWICKTCGQEKEGSR